ncbi:MAG TPA: M42 family peptidase [candidate division WOR-3 bacterium]|uniref:M42 family peptidase n=1 Tax=candidate division WOR-3 bacterium TaxID=2052148 RepID=A0A7V0T760_UNCW3|nr:M42 family peptidase [candidate division WOR-3 bacterium]
MADRQLLKELTEAFGPSGYETEPAAILVRELSRVGEVTRDGLGSVICRVAGRSERPRVMISAHMDEVGFLVKAVTGDGYVRFLPIGGWWPQVLLGQRVVLRTRKGDFTGVIGSKPPHELTDEERKKLPDINTMFMDFGCRDGLDLVKETGLRRGDPVVPVCPFSEMAGGLLMAKAWDDRGGCGMLVELARRLGKGRFPGTLFLVGSAQEEVGLRGARTAAEVVKPDVALALDVSLCGEYPDRSRKDVEERLGNGAAILVHDMSMIPNTRLRDFAIGAAESAKARFHLTTVRGGYDTGAIHLTGGGVPSLAVGWPTRYIHSHTGIVAEEDYDSVVGLTAAVIERLDAAAAESIRSF